MFGLKGTQWCVYISNWDTISLKLMACQWLGIMPLSELDSIKLIFILIYDNENFAKLRRLMLHMPLIVFGLQFLLFQMTAGLHDLFWQSGPYMGIHWYTNHKANVNVLSIWYYIKKNYTEIRVQEGHGSNKFQADIYWLLRLLLIISIFR